MRHKNTNNNLSSQISTTLETAAQEAWNAVDQRRDELQCGCYEALSHCTTSTGIPDELSQQVKAEVEALQRASATLEAAHKAASHLADELNARCEDTRKAVVRKWYRLNPPANSIIDRQEAEKRHFAAGMGFYKLVLVFVLGSFAGVVVETLWCLLRHGYFESRNGLLWGPFSPLYGLGAATLSLMLYRFRNRGKWLSFAGGFIIGTVVEYVCSWWQEWAFGSRSWDYSRMPFNINGRVCLLYSIFWGVLGVLWIKDIYPRLSKWILKLPQKSGVIITWCLTVFMIVNCAVSGLAVLRWSDRVHGAAPRNAYEAFMDKQFPDERMESIWANMDFGLEDHTTGGEDSQ